MFRPALVLFALLTLLTRIVYPAAITGIAQLLFADKANSSIMTSKDGTALGSALIGQEFGAGELRKKLESDPAQPRFLITEPGIVYRFVEPRPNE